MPRSACEDVQCASDGPSSPPPEADRDVARRREAIVSRQSPTHVGRRRGRRDDLEVVRMQMEG